MRGLSPEPTPSIAAKPRSLIASFSPTAVAVGMFLALSGLFAARWLVGHVAVWRILRGSRRGSGRVARLFAEQAADFPEPPRLLVSERITVPVCFGLWRPTVLLPAALTDSADETTLRWVIAHELAHLRNGDVATALWFGLAQSLYFPVPWFWWLKRRVALCQEFVADAAAASVTGRVEDYAECLLNLSRGAAPARPALAATGVLGRPSDLYRRISNLLKEKDSMNRRTTLAERLLTAAVLLAFGVALAGVGLHRPTSAAAQNEAPRKEEPKKDETKKDELKKPAAFDPDDFNKQFQKMQERLAEQQKMIEEMQKRMLDRGFGGPNDMNRRMRQMQEDAQRRIEELQNRGGLGGAFMLPGLPGQGNPFAGFSRGHARLGAVIEKPSPAMVDQLDLPKDQGLVIGAVTPDSAAAKAGLKSHDILLEIGGKAVSSDPTEFRKQLGEIKANAPVDAVVLRKGKKETIKGINLPEAKAELPEVPGFGGLGGIDVIPGVLELKALPVPVVEELIGPGAKVAGVQVQINDGQFTIHSTKDDLDITITGTVDGAAKVESVKITDGKEKVTADSLDKVPAKYKDQVQKLLKNVGGSKE